MTHPVEQFWNRLATFPPGYPSGVMVPIPETIRGTGFFAAAAGLFVGAGQGGRGGTLPRFPERGVMFVAKDVNAEVPYREAVRRGQLTGLDQSQLMPTWRVLRTWLESAGLETTDCFFTNTWVGLRAGSIPSGNLSARLRPYRSYRRWCQEFLEEQMALMKPALVVFLGSEGARTEFYGLTGEEIGTRRFGEHMTAYVGLLHPSARVRLEVRAEQANRLRNALRFAGYRRT